MSKLLNAFERRIIYVKYGSNVSRVEEYMGRNYIWLKPNIEGEVVIIKTHFFDLKSKKFRSRDFVSILNEMELNKVR